MTKTIELVWDQRFEAVRDAFTAGGLWALGRVR